MKKRKYYRNIVIESIQYQYKIGKSFVHIICETGKSFFVNFSELTGISFSDIENLKWNRGFSITPKNIANIIKVKG